MSGEVSAYAERWEERMAAALDRVWPPIPNPPLSIVVPADPSLPIGARIRAVLADYPGGATLSQIQQRADVSWDQVFAVIMRALRDHSIRVWQGKDFMSQGQKVDGTLRYVLTEGRRR